MKKNFHASMLKKPDRGGLAIAAIYLLVGGLWILFSDKLAAMLFTDHGAYMQVSIYKGWGYVLVTGIMLYLLIQRDNRSLREANKNYLLLAEHISDVVWVLNLTARRFTYISPSIQSLRGLTPAEALREPLTEALTPSSWGHVSSHLPRRLDEFKRGEIKFYTDELEQPCKDGSTVWVEVKSRFAADPQTGDIEIYATSRDITERRQAAEKLHIENERFLRFTDSNIIGIAIAESSGRIVQANDYYLNLLGVTRQDFLDDKVNWRNFTPPEWLPLDEKALREVQERGVSEPYEKEYQRADGSRVAVYLANAILPGPEKQIAAYIIDITDRKRAEKQLAQMKRLYATLSQVNQTIVRVKQSGELYQSICDVAVQFGEFILAWIGLLDESTGDLRPVAAAGLDVAHWPFPIINIHDGSRQIGVPAEAIRTSQVVTSEDIQTDERTRNLHQHLQGYSYHSLASIPFRLQGRTIGVLNLVSSETGFFKVKEELLLLDEMGLDISYALDILENSKAMRQWADAFEHCAHGIDIVYPATNQIITCNTAFAQMQAGTVEELTGTPILDLYAPEDREAVKQYIAEADRTGSIQYEAHMVRRDGHIYPVQMDLVSVRDEKGNLLYRVATQQNITQRKRAEAALRDSEIRFSKIFHASPMGINIFRLSDGRSVDVNDTFLQIVGYERREFIGHSAADLDLFVDTDTRHLWMQQLQETGSVRNQDARIRRKSGEIRDALASIEVIELNGEPMALVIASDITERKQAEEKLRNSEALLSEAQRIGRIGSWEWIPPGVEMRCSDEFYSIFEIPYRQSAISQRTISAMMPPEDQERLRVLDLQAFAEQTDIDYEYRVTLPSGKPLWLHQLGKVTYGKDGKPVRIMGIVQDITERKQAAEALQQSEERYRHTLDNMLEGCQIIDFDWRYVYVNEAAARQGHGTRETLLHHTMMEMYPGIEKTVLFDALRECMQGRITSQFENEFTYPDGSSGWFELSIQPAPEGLFILSIDVTERKQAEQEMRQRTEDLLLINALNESINLGEELESITEVFARETRNTFHCQDATIYLLSPDGKYLEMQSSTLSQQLRGEIEKLIGRSLPRIRIPLREGGHFKRIMSSPNGIIISNPDAIQQWMLEFTETTSLPEKVRPLIGKAIPNIYKVLQIRSAMTIPLISSGQAIGLLDLSSRGQFTEEDLQRIRTISSQITAAIVRKQTEQRVQLQLQRMSALGEIDRAITSSLDMHVSLEILLSEVVTQLGVDAATVLLLNSTSKTLEYFAGKGFHTPAIRQSRMSVGEGFAGQVGLERRIVFIPNLIESPRYQRASLLREEKFQAYLGVPLMAKGQLKGVLEIFHRSSLNPDAEWLNYLETLGGQAAIAVDNAQLFEGMQQSNLELVAAYDATIAGWSQAMDLRDKETEGHTQRVTELTIRLAEKMGINKQEIVHIRRGALLHDIGKLGVPDHVLLKPGPLTDEEWTVMRKHPSYALEMLQPISYLRPALDIPYCHHERWDGSGYPRGLKGELIPLAARLFAVVDVWDALTSDRPYRKRWTAEKTRTYLQEQAGILFDPYLVEMFLGMIKE